MFFFTLKTWSFGPGQNYMALLWSFVSKNTNYKHQITNKPACHCEARAGRSQIPIFNDPNLPGWDIVWIFEFRSLDIVWYL